ncbi:hypothetical protein SI65_10297 [Aspergillus cristatus]|uniref:Uncharacterized protein n=1 Tax=Aspergillus cristatus TaxID=573508 RepID=A0A1E3B037_ASPCR|nr:hypothetical protein SI65_10297 [Aspergillus cristatus]
MSGESQTGWAIRRYCPDTQNCPTGESGVNTWGDWYACCPEGTWANITSNTRCGPVDADFTPKARCANSTWTLWYAEGYFCCDNVNDLRGYYYNSNYYVGCATSSWINNASHANSDVRRAASYPNAPESTSKTSSTNKGAIAGGVVGGVCGAFIIVGIIWFLCYRRRQSKTPKNEETSNSPPLQLRTHYENIRSELGDNSRGPSELDGSLDRKEMSAATQPRQELAGSTPQKQPPSELA